VGHLFPPLGRELVTLLRGLPPEAWSAPTVCRAWAVRDIAAHLLDTGLRRLSFGRDDHTRPPPERPITGYADLVAFLNAANAEWVAAARRLSPRLLVDLLEWLEPQLAEHLASIDPDGQALFSVAWAGEETSAAWFDVARELTERWLHQQQIRLAVGAPPLADPELSRAVFDTFLRALPHAYAAVEAPVGARLQISIRGGQTYDYTLERTGGGWRLLAGVAASAAPAPSSRVTLDEEPAWLLLTRGLRPEEGRSRATIDGDAALADAFFHAVAVMA
jgi:uncharacterized protein (TIGR03083 family)